MAGFRRWATGVIAVLMVVTAGCSSGGASGDAEPEAQGDVITIRMRDNSFSPAEATVRAGSTVTFKLTNVGKLPHNMRIASLRGIFRESEWASKPEPLSNPGTTGTLVWQVPVETGVYKFRCDIHEGMTGTITVE